MKLLASSIALLALSGLAAHAADIGQSTKAELKGNEGQMIGSATLTEAPKGVVMRVEVQGLTPGWHGLHFHEKGDCSKSDFTSAGGHVHTQASMVHGLLNPDANESGDLPNLYVADSVRMPALAQGTPYDDKADQHAQHGRQTAGAGDADANGARRTQSS